MSLVLNRSGLILTSRQLVTEPDGHYISFGTQEVTLSTFLDTTLSVMSGELANHSSIALMKDILNRAPRWFRRGVVVSYEQKMVNRRLFMRLPITKEDITRLLAPGQSMILFGLSLDTSELCESLIHILTTTPLDGQTDLRILFIKKLNPAFQVPDEGEFSRIESFSEGESPFQLEFLPELSEAAS